MRRDLVCASPHIDLLVDIHTRNDEEHSRTPGSSRQQPTQSEDDRPLVLLDHLDAPDEREGESDENEEEGADGEEDSAEVGTLATDSDFFLTSTTTSASSSLGRTGEMNGIHLSFNNGGRVLSGPDWSPPYPSLEPPCPAHC